jgi:hypothetical protein
LDRKSASKRVDSGIYSFRAGESAGSGGKPLKKVYLAYALLALVVILLLYAQLSHTPA